MEVSKQLKLWQSDADRLCRPVRWLPFWRPKVICKRGLFSPWFWPLLWLTRSGAFNFFFLLIVSDDMLDCPPGHRRAVIAHECGHLCGFHSFIWLGVTALLLKTPALPAGFRMISASVGPFHALAALVAFFICLMRGLKALMYWFEHQADDYAAAMVGGAEVAAALKWLQGVHPRAQRSSWLAARIQRLENLSAPQTRKPS